MRDRDYYPAGAYRDASAPYNEVEVPERDFEVDVEYVLQKKDVLVTTNDYVPEFDEETGHTDANTLETDWKKAYEDGHYTIPELLEELKNYIKEDLERYKGSSIKERQLKEMLEDCEGWELVGCYYHEAE